MILSSEGWNNLSFSAIGLEIPWSDENSTEQVKDGVIYTVFSYFIQKMRQHTEKWFLKKNFNLWYNFSVIDMLVWLHIFYKFNLLLSAAGAISQSNEASVVGLRWHRNPCRHRKSTCFVKELAFSNTLVWPKKRQCIQWGFFSSIISSSFTNI